MPDFKIITNKYFATRRFDIDGRGQRLHTATAGALLGISLHEPFMDYTNLLALTGFITQNRDDVEQMFRRMLFNYFTDNKDDHCKNFSFYVTVDEAKSEWRWRLAPAYDLTHCTEGYNGEHPTSVCGKGHPSIADFIEAGRKIKIPETRCRQIIDEVEAGCTSIRPHQSH